MSDPALNPVPAWFHNAMVDGLMRLHTLCLPGTPSAETVTLTAQVWIDALWDAGTWHPQDLQRLQRGFLSLARVADRWPVPRQLKEQLPARPEAAALPAPAVPTERRRAGIELVRSKVRELREQMTMRAPPAPASATAIAAALRAQETVPPSPPTTSQEAHP